MEKKELNLVEILKDCPKGTKLYSPLVGDVVLVDVDCDYIKVINKKSLFDEPITLFHDGRFFNEKGSECMLFPSKDNRDWSTFKVEKPKFDPKTLQPFDKVLGTRDWKPTWEGDFFLYMEAGKYIGIGGVEYDKMIPYNEETKHLLGTDEKAPEYYDY